MASAPAQDQQTLNLAKLHALVDAPIQEIVAVEITGNFVDGSEVLPDLLNQWDDQDSASTVAGDGAYDTVKVIE